MEVTPSSHCGLLVPEPFRGHLRDVGGGHVRDASGDLSAVDQTVQIGQLLGIGQGDVRGLVEFQQIVEIFVPCAEDLRLVDLYGSDLTYWA